METLDVSLRMLLPTIDVRKKLFGIMYLYLLHTLTFKSDSRICMFKFNNQCRINGNGKNQTITFTPYVPNYSILSIKVFVPY
jgi:hypothetical protein